jgi:polysaccharide export outer membrane protein
MCVVGVTALRAQVPEYLIGRQDTLTITVFGQPDISGKFTVEADGCLTFPMIGRVEAAGMTPRSVEAAIAARLGAGYLLAPQVSVTVDQYRSQRVFMMGAVGQPGPLVLTGNTTLIEALARAGSTTGESVGDVIVVRAQPGQAASGPVLPEQAADTRVIRIDLAELERGALTQNVVLQDGDTVIVPRGEPVFLVGEVRSPGSFAVRKGTTILQLLALGGGATERGATGRLKIVRVQNGKRVEIDAELDDVVQSGDTVVVPEKYF